ncbi:MAG TPA: choice-of-anchor tandem repeat GloVer-containing protein [Candidatus Cybelea sp.]|jgi:uncharacterized repeat protein (TIGR03803 family)
MRIAALVISAMILASCTRAAGTGSLPSDVANAVGPATSYRIIYRFAGSGDGNYPAAGMIAESGTLYGTTLGGGIGGYGTVFSITTAGSEGIVSYFLGQQDGEKLDAGLVAANGLMYGTTEDGGMYGKGVLFSVSSRGKTSLHYFGSRGDGAHPRAGLLAFGQKLYGSTAHGGRFDGGTLYSITASGQESVLHSFGPSDLFGTQPGGNLISSGSKMYGTAAEGGPGKGGVAFWATPSGRAGRLHSFGYLDDGKNPEQASLLQFRGAMYGTTCKGGKYGDGVIFRLTASGIEKVIYSFGKSPRDGACPMAGLVSAHGLFYGTTSAGGDKGEGTVFAALSQGGEIVLHSFAGGSDGATPAAPLTVLQSNLYGTTSLGGDGFGTVFKIGFVGQSQLRREVPAAKSAASLGSSFSFASTPASSLPGREPQPQR